VHLAHGVAFHRVGVAARMMIVSHGY
jgi:hypothetical protein